MDETLDYAFPHSAADEARRLELFQQRLDPLTIRRIERLGIGAGAACLEIGGGRGSITRWLAERVGAGGHVTATDLQVEFLRADTPPNVEVLLHDIRTDSFPQESFDLVHTRAVLMHIPDDPDLLSRMVTWLRPGGWLLLEEPDFGMWLADADPQWRARPDVWRRTFPSGSLSRGRSLLEQVPRLGLADVGADAELDIVAPGTPLSEFYSLSTNAIRKAAEQPDAPVESTTEPDLACGFVHIGVWGRRP